MELTRRAPPVRHCRYIRWAQEAYPSGATEVRLILERCVRECHKNERYKQDKRFVRTCVKYADACKDAETVFDFMAKQQIGSECTFFYVARSAIYESGLDYQAAERVLEEGLRKGAQPLEELQARAAAFHRRMAKREKVTGSTAAKKAERSTAGSSSSRSRGQRAGHGKERKLQRIGSKSAASGRRPMSRPTKGQHPNSRRPEISARGHTIAGNLQIYEDSNVEGVTTTSEECNAPWDQLAPHAQRQKENSAAATAWTECSIAQRSEPSVPATTFSVFTEDECHSAACPGNVSRATKRREGLRQQLDQPDTASEHAMLIAASSSDQVDQSAASAGGLTVFEDEPVQRQQQQQERKEDPVRLTVFQDNSDDLTATADEDEGGAGASPTVNTAAAMNDVASMFSGPLARTESDASCTTEEVDLPCPRNARCSSIGLQVFEDQSAASAGGLTVFEDEPVQRQRQQQERKEDPANQPSRIASGQSFTIFAD